MRGGDYVDGARCRGGFFGCVDVGESGAVIQIVGLGDGKKL
jgi:hypothetical protein